MSTNMSTNMSSSLPPVASSVSDDSLESVSLDHSSPRQSGADLPKLFSKAVTSAGIDSSSRHDLKLGELKEGAFFSPLARPLPREGRRQRRRRSSFARAGMAVFGTDTVAVKCLESTKRLPGVLKPHKVDMTALAILEARQLKIEEESNLLRLKHEALRTAGVLPPSKTSSELDALMSGCRMPVVHWTDKQEVTVAPFAVSSQVCKGSIGSPAGAGYTRRAHRPVARKPSLRKQEMVSFGALGPKRIDLDKLRKAETAYRAEFSGEDLRAKVSISALLGVSTSLLQAPMCKALLPMLEGTCSVKEMNILLDSDRTYLSIDSQTNSWRCYRTDERVVFTPAFRKSSAFGCSDRYSIASQSVAGRVSSPASSGRIGGRSVKDSLHATLGSPCSQVDAAFAPFLMRCLKGELPVSEMKVLVDRHSKGSTYLNINGKARTWTVLQEHNRAAMGVSNAWSKV